MAFDINDWQIATQDNLTFAPTLQDNQQVVDVNDTSTVKTIYSKGLNVLSDKIGFYDGSNWRSYLAADGTFGFYNEDQSSYLRYDGTDFEFNGKVSFANTDMTDYTLSTELTTAISEREQAEAALQTAITEEAAARLEGETVLTQAYQNYTDTVKQALIDGEISDAEAAAIAEAQVRVNTAKADLQAQIDAISLVEDINWQQEVQTALDDNTTTIDGSRIITGTILADRINTNGLIAENISANEIVGKTITGSVLNGARINGAVIKASYLDLDGELEVLTNFHISVATYNSNPSLYSDAVYIETDNEYRIPSLSTIREDNRTVNSSANSWLYSLIRAYNVANAGHNNKIVKNIPTITASVDSPVWVFNSNFTESYSFTGESGGVFTPVTSNKTNSFRVYVGGSYSQVITVSHIANPEYSSDTGYWYSELLIKYGSTVIYDGYAVNAEANTYTFSVNGLTFRLSYPKVRYDTVVTPSGFYSTTTHYCELDLKVELVAGDHTVSASLGNYLLKGNTPTVQTAGYIKANYMKFPSSILVNNMI